jgi:hypothetical protein
MPERRVKSIQAKQLNQTARTVRIQAVVVNKTRDGTAGNVSLHAVRTFQNNHFKSWFNT